MIRGTIYMRRNLDSRWTGPKVWDIMHMVAYTYNPDAKAKYKDFYETIADLFPCHVCRNHYKSDLKTIDLTSWQTLRSWVHRIRFKKKEQNLESTDRYYRSRMKNDEFEPSVAGPAIWFMLHAFAFSYAKSAQRAWRRFFNSLQYVIPNQVCRTTMVEMLPRLEMPADILADADSLFRFIYDFHETINERLGKRGPSFQAVVNFYST